MQFDLLNVIYTIKVHSRKISFFFIGFLYISKENKGDYALQDIYTALHWLKNNVIHFNGDPDRITLYGTGTGAVLASLVVMLETVNGLYINRKNFVLIIHFEFMFRWNRFN